MKKTIFLILSVLFCTSVIATDDQDARNFIDDNSCEMSNKEVSVCAVIVCDFGLLFGEWSSECTDHKWKLIRWASNPFSSLPKCFDRDSNCERNGAGRSAEISQDDCDLMHTDIERETCELALDPNIDWSQVAPYDGPLVRPVTQPIPTNIPDPDLPVCSSNQANCHHYQIP